MKKSVGTVAGALMGAALLVGVTAAPASAATLNGNRTCAQYQQVRLSTNIPSQGNAGVKTSHNHIYGGANHFFSYVSFGVKTSSSGTSRTSTYTASTDPASVGWLTTATACAAAPV